MIRLEFTLLKKLVVDLKIGSRNWDSWDLVITRSILSQYMGGLLSQ